MKKYRNYAATRPIREHLQERFDVSDMGPGLKRGMVLSVYKAKIKEVTGTETFTRELKKAVLLPQDHQAPGYEHPTLVVGFAPGSLWPAELHRQRLQLLEAINERVGGEEFLTAIKFK